MGLFKPKFGGPIETSTRPSSQEVTGQQLELFPFDAWEYTKNTDGGGTLVMKEAWRLVAEGGIDVTGDVVLSFQGDDPDNPVAGNSRIRINSAGLYYEVYSETDEWEIKAQVGGPNRDGIPDPNLKGYGLVHPEEDGILEDSYYLPQGFLAENWIASGQNVEFARTGGAFTKTISDAFASTSGPPALTITGLTNGEALFESELDTDEAVISGWALGSRTIRLKKGVTYNFGAVASTAANPTAYTVSPQLGDSLSSQGWVSQTGAQTFKIVTFQYEFASTWSMYETFVSMDASLEVATIGSVTKIGSSGFFDEDDGYDRALSNSWDGIVWPLRIYYDTYMEGPLTSSGMWRTDFFYELFLDRKDGARPFGDTSDTAESYIFDGWVIGFTLGVGITGVWRNRFINVDREVDIITTQNVPTDGEWYWYEMTVRNLKRIQDDEDYDAEFGFNATATQYIDNVPQSVSFQKNESYTPTDSTFRGKVITEWTNVDIDVNSTGKIADFIAGFTDLVINEQYVLDYYTSGKPWNISFSADDLILMPNFPYGKVVVYGALFDVESGLSVQGEPGEKGDKGDPGIEVYVQETEPPFANNGDIWIEPI
jgi:hypothetical protein